MTRKTPPPPPPPPPPPRPPPARRRPTRPSSPPYCAAMAASVRVARAGPRRALEKRRPADPNVDSRADTTAPPPPKNDDDASSSSSAEEELVSSAPRAVVLPPATFTAAIRTPLDHLEPLRGGRDVLPRVRARVDHPAVAPRAPKRPIPRVSKPPCRSRPPRTPRPASPASAPPRTRSPRACREEKKKKTPPPPPRRSRARPWRRRAPPRAARTPSASTRRRVQIAPPRGCAPASRPPYRTTPPSCTAPTAPPPGTRRTTPRLWPAGAVQDDPGAVLRAVVRRAKLRQERFEGRAPKRVAADGGAGVQDEHDVPEQRGRGRVRNVRKTVRSVRIFRSERVRSRRRRTTRGPPRAAEVGRRVRGVVADDARAVARELVSRGATPDLPAASHVAGPDARSAAAICAFAGGNGGGGEEGAGGGGDGAATAVRTVAANIATDVPRAPVRRRVRAFTFAVRRVRGVGRRRRRRRQRRVFFFDDGAVDDDGADGARVRVRAERHRHRVALASEHPPVVARRARRAQSKISKNLAAFGEASFFFSGGRGRPSDAGIAGGASSRTRTSHAPPGARPRMGSPRDGFDEGRVTSAPGSAPVAV